ncbi:MAG: thioesterase [Chlorogloeopsis fritschii C42_A2020_084]|uniref:thioesterase II family protein n=1 Tax=Chlorogloeopsis fritschii TaxID=1124 RepID=UPI0019EC893B|nr:thioesterase II family protein [Chlorogloeopsis fritschii]MBF2004926.1 thioesterase [Chlorogloeopsis fritschii C42_A2020_084]
MTNTQFLNSLITCPKPNPQASVRLFCFPYAGGSSLIFRQWRDYLPATIELCPVEIPGRGTQMKSPPFTRLEPLVRVIASAIQPYLDKPFAFFGHSMGGLVSFELTRLLRKQYGISPNYLFISGRCAPQVPNSEPPIHNLPEQEFLEELRRFNGTPTSVLENSELMQLFLPILRADFAVLETYVYAEQPPLNYPITVCGGLQDQEVSYDQLLAWQEQTCNSFSVHMLPGDHFFVHSSQQQLLEIISRTMNEFSHLSPAD